MADATARMDALANLFAFIDQYLTAHPHCTKDELAQEVAQQFRLQHARSVYVGQDFAIRFSTASGSSFSNTVLSLSTLAKYDDLPVVVCVVRPASAQLLLSNSTLIDKLSHSSQRLSHHQIRGSFNGTNILREFDGLTNEPRNFEALFSKHCQIGFEENYDRIVENTLAIKGRYTKFAPTSPQLATILGTAQFAKNLLRDPCYKEFATSLAVTVDRKCQAILAAARSENTKLRGDAIEQVISNAANLHGLEDVVETLKSGAIMNIDIKTKLIGRLSAPKAYNVDKILRLLATDRSAFAFFFVGIDLDRQLVVPRLISFLDTAMLAATRVQHHWAGLNSRGVTQLTGDLSFLFDPSFRESIDVPRARDFLQRLIDM